MSYALPQPTVADLRTTSRLTPAQRRFLKHFAESGLQRRFYLAGGAALTAGYLAHRSVEDLDLFGPDPVPIQKLLPMMKALPELESLQWLLPRDRTTFLITWSDTSQVKVEYRQFPFAHIHPPWSVGPFYVASLPDLLADKIAALTERRYPLDRCDILSALEQLEDLTFDIGVTLAERKFELPKALRRTAYERMSVPLSTIPERLHEPQHTRTLIEAWLALHGPPIEP
ncbi:MAG: nucleotidyl transferase AbiEii/AbiGii toxin family protein [Myxococcota bacterium]